MKKYFPGSTTKNEYCAYRDTTPQVLKQSFENKIIFNKRKLNEFINLIHQIDSKSLSFEI